MVNIQRYMSGETARKVLSDNGLYFRRLDCQSADPTEGDREFYGSFETSIKNALNHQISKPTDKLTDNESAEIFLNLMESEKKNKFIQCWFFSNESSPHMWNRFALYDKNKDCALFVANRFILSDYLSKVLPIGYDFKLIEYVEDKHSKNNTDYIKANTYIDENEIRILIDIRPLILFNRKILQNTYNNQEVYFKENLGENLKNNGVADENLFIDVDEKGFILKAPLSEIITNVFIPNDASIEFENELNELLSLNNYRFTCARINVKNTENINR